MRRLGFEFIEIGCKTQAVRFCDNVCSQTIELLLGATGTGWVAESVTQSCPLHRKEVCMRSSFKAFLLCISLVLTMLSCNEPTNQSGSTSPSQSTSAKRYPLKGKVVSIDKRANMANIDGEDVPGFMSAMTMPYVVKPASQLDKLAPGDAITADVVVQGDESWIENVAVTSRGTASAPM